MNENLVVVRGAGDLATGVIQKLWRSGFRVVALEVPQPTTIRRSVALSTAITAGTMRVEDLTAVVAGDLEQAAEIIKQGNIPILRDPQGESIAALRPLAVVEAILAKRNLGTHRQMAPITIGLGPGFRAPQDVSAVIETMRGHNLGRLILEGSALANTGVPGELGGQSVKRVIHAPVAGVVHHEKKIGDVVNAGDILFWIDQTPVRTLIDGVVRGLIAEGMQVPAGMKSADVDPRLEVLADIDTISDKARCLGGAVLEAVMYLHGKGQGQ